MEYFLGSLITLISLFIFDKMTKKIINNKIKVPELSQTRKLQLVREYIQQAVEPKPNPKTQSGEHRKKNSIKAFFWGDNVYWIESGFLVMAKLNNNEIDETTKKRVDTYTLDRVELDKITFIVDKLTEGNKDDSGNSGK